jgi:hypothetical protein
MTEPKIRKRVSVAFEFPHWGGELPLCCCGSADAFAPIPGLPAVAPNGEL